MPMVKLYGAEDLIEAHLIKHMLEQQEIPVFITGEHLEGAAGEVPAMGLIDVWVLEDFYEDALDVLEDFFESQDGPCEDDDDLRDEDGYYVDDTVEAEEEFVDDRPAHDSPDNPWNRVYRKPDRS